MNIFADTASQETASGVLQKESSAQADVLGSAAFKSGSDGEAGGNGFDFTTSAFTSGAATPASGAGGGSGTIKLNLSR